MNLGTILVATVVAFLLVSWLDGGVLTGLVIFVIVLGLLRIFGSGKKKQSKHRDGVDINTIVEFMQAYNNKEGKLYIEQHRELLTDEALHYFEALAQDAKVAGKDFEELCYRHYLSVLASCQFKGIDATFATFSASASVISDREKLYMLLIADDETRIQFLKEHPELLPDFFQAGSQAQAIQSQEDEQFQKLNKPIEQLGEQDEREQAIEYPLQKTESEIDDFSEADALRQNFVAIKKNIQEEDNPQYANTLINLGETCSKTNRYEEVKQLFQQALAIRLNAPEEQHGNFTGNLNKLAELHQKVEFLRSGPEVFTPKFLQLKLAQSLYELAEHHKKMKNYAAAVPLYQELVELNREVPDTVQGGLPQILYNLAESYIAMQNYSAAEPFYQEILEIARTTYGEQHSHVAAPLLWLANLYKEMGKYNEAEPLYRQALEILGEEVPIFVSILDSLIEIYIETDNYVKAQPLVEQFLEITRRKFGEDPLELLGVLNRLGEIYKNKEKLTEAEQYYQQAIEIGRKSFDKTHRILVGSLQGLGSVYHRMGRFIDAIALDQQALEIIRKSHGENSPEFAICLDNLGGEYETTGNYTKAIQLRRQSLAIFQDTIGEDNAHFATTLSSLSLAYENIGDYASAETNYLRVLEIRRRVHGADHGLVGVSLNLLGGVYLRMGKYTKAEPLYQEALEIERKAGENSSYFAMRLNSLAYLYHAMGKYNEAEALYQQSIMILGKTLGKSHGELSGRLFNLGALYHELKRYNEAEPLYQQAFEISYGVHGKEALYFAQPLDVLAQLFIVTERQTEAMLLMKKAAAIYDNIVAQVFSISSEYQRMNYLKGLRASLNRLISLVINQDISYSPEILQDIFDLILRRKGIGFEALAVQRDTVLGGRYPVLEPKLYDLVSLRFQIAQQTLAGPKSGNIDEHKQYLRELNGQKEQIESELAQQIPEMRLMETLQAVDSEAVFSGLPDKTDLIEFVRFDLFDFERFDFFDFMNIPGREVSQQRQSYYLAFVLAGESSSNISMINLGEAEPIDRLIADYRASITGETEYRGLFYGDKQESYEEISGLELGQKLRAAIFDPLLSTLGDCRRLFLSPDGDLNRLPFEILPTDDGHHLIDDYQISYVNIGRDILRFGAEHTGEPTESMVVADPDFGLMGERDEQGKQSVNETEVIIRQESVTRGRQSQDLDRAGLNFSRLPGTRTEGQHIAEMLGVSPIMADAALEKKVKTVKSPCILHIATHGFFLPDQQRDPNEERLVFAPMSRGVDSDWGRLAHGMENPLLRSGLALAGANTWLNHGTLPPEAEDGILTAEDVTGLDLLATELVVLSACETGLGQVQVGEGVFGLRRAFMLAGAKTLVMSLWKVPDQQTQELMTDFYRRVLTGEPRAMALRQAQLTLKEKYPAPLYWGAFICQGDPGPLERFIEE